MGKLVDELVQSPARTGLLRLLLQARVTASMRELAIRCGLSHQAVRKEVEHLERLGLVTVRASGPAHLVSANWDHPANPHLLALLDLEGEAPLHEADDGRVREALAAFGAPLLEVSPEPHWSLEETVVRAIKVARRDATVLRVIPVVLAKNRRVLDFKPLFDLACRHKVKAELGMLLELVSELLGDPSLAIYSDRLHDRRRTAWRYFPEARSRFEAELAARNAPEVARRWHFHSNMSVDSFRSLLSKHCPELMHA